MAGFCNMCGQPLRDGAQFCSGCGKAVAQAVQAPPQQSTSQQPQWRPAQPQRPQAPQTMQAVAQQAAGLLQSTQWAPSQQGEVVLPLPKAPPVLKPLLSTGQVLGGGIGGYFKNMGKAFAKPQRWIPALLLAAAWVAAMLPAVQSHPTVAKVLGLLTFARGGMDENPLYAMGGIFGKGVVAMLFSQLLTGGFWKGLAGAFTGGFKRLAAPRLADVGALLLGAGLALAVFNFTTGSPSLADAVVALSGALLSLKALGRKGGFVKRLLLSFGAKKQTSRPALVQTANRTLAGCAAGWALAVPLSVVPIGFVCYIAGGVLALAGLILLLVGGGQKGVAPA